jgi:iron complex outermembrane receptor protein
MKKVLLLIFVYAVILAQPVEKSDSLKYNLNQVTITATRYSEPLIEIPFSISIINEGLSTIKGYGFDEILNSAPGVLAQSRAGNQDVRVTIRGFGARGAGDRSNSGTSRGIRVLVDGIPETEPDGRTSFDLIDLGLSSSIEVVRSNASSIWGNASGGVINISMVPSSNKSFAEIIHSIGPFGFKQTRLKSLANLENGKVFLNISNSSFAGWRKNSSSYRTLVNIGVLTSFNSRSNLNIFASAVSNMFHVPGPLTESQYNNNPQSSNLFYSARDERRHNKIGKLGFTFEYKFDEQNSIDFMSFISPKYLQRSERGTFRDFTRYFAGGNLIYKNQSTFGDSFGNYFVAGIDEAYQDGAILFYNLSASNGRGDKLRTNKREGANNFGAFLQNEIIYDDKLSLIAGGRYDAVTYYSENYLDPGIGLNEKVFEKFTPKVGLTYRITPSISLFTNIGGGVEVPAGNETDPLSTFGDDKLFLLNPLLEPIISTTYEFGTKQIWYWGDENFMRYLMLELSAYRINIENDIVPYGGGAFYLTSGKSHRDGVELFTEAEFKQRLKLKASFTYLNSKYDEYLVDSLHYKKSGATANYSGNKTAGIPESFYNLTIEYKPEFLKHVLFSYTFGGTSSYYVDDANKVKVPSSSISNIKLAFIKPLDLVGGIYLTGFISVNNLFNTKYVSSSFINPDIMGGEAYYIEPGLPRNYLFSISLGVN